MSKERMKRIAEFRQSQPKEELLRKLNKAIGRHSNQCYLQEALDVADVNAKEIAAKIKFE